MDTIASRLLRSSTVQRRLADVLVRGVARDFPAVSIQVAPVPAKERRALLLWASAFASTPETMYQDAALRIAVDALNYHEGSDAERVAATVLLHRMSNRPAIRLAASRGLIGSNFLDSLPLPLEIEQSRRDMLDTIPLSSGGIIEANQFQRSMWDALSAAQIVSATAPTSAGKSYLLMRWIEDFLRTREQAVVVYVVPTRALVAEVEAKLAFHLSKAELRGVWVSSVPAIPPDGVQRDVFVATQERYHLMLRDRADDWAPHLLIVDEAQKVADGHRGILLQDVIEQTLHRNPHCHVVMASPFVTNPEALLDVGPANALREPVLRPDITVVQNVLWATQVPRKPRQWRLAGFVGGARVEVGGFELSDIPGSVSKRLPLVARALAGESTGNIVYANGPAEAEKFAKLLSGATPNDAPADHADELQEAVKLVRDAVHPRYVLADHLKAGVAFHYGNIPSVVRSEIERLFRKSAVRWLVCTSTLMEGVNLPCRNLFLRGPRKGTGNPMQAPDFWNLAGRAGRWGVEFAGNIVCVDPNDVKAWPYGAFTTRTPQTVAPVATEILLNPGPFLHYLDQGAPPCGETPDAPLEALYSRFATVVAKGGHIATLGWMRGIPQNTVAEVEFRIRKLVSHLTLPAKLFVRNPGVSPTGMEALLTVFRRAGQRAEHFAPLPVESPASVDSFAEVMGVCDQSLGPVFGPAAFRTAVAIVSVNWMRGKRVREIIDSKVAYLQKQRREYSIGDEIRDVLDTIEKYSRYRVPKYFGCYTDVLRHYFATELERPDLADDVPDFSQNLEFGVSQKTQISLMMLGFSRYTALALAEFISGSRLSAVDCLRWLQNFDASAYGLRNVVVREIEQVLAARTSVLSNAGET